MQPLAERRSRLPPAGVWFGRAVVVNGAPNLRRLHRGSPIRAGDANPFESARRARAERVLRVGFQAASAAVPGSPTEWLLDALRTPSSYRAIEVVPLKDRALRWLPRSRRFRVFRRRTGELEAASRSTDERGRRVLHLHALDGHERWQWVARELGRAGDIADFLELEALAAHGADVIVTEDPTLVANRDHRLLRELNLMTPAEAGVVIGAWTRAIHQAFITYAGVNNGLYYWAAARAVTPAAWTAHCAFVHGARALPDGGELVDLSGSILDHLKAMFGGLDRVLATWQCGTNNDTSDELLHEFVQLVLAAWSVHDNIALLSGRYLAIDLQPKHGPMWELAKKAWVESMRRRAATDERAGRMVGLIEDHLRYIEALRDLRNHLAHRARDRMIHIHSTGGEPDYSRFVVKGEFLSQLRDRLATTPEGAEAWGFEQIVDYGDVEVTDVSTGETYVEAMGRRSMLDLVLFAARLVAYVALLANETYRSLEPSADARIPHREKCDGSRPAHWGTPEGATSVVAFSGVAGLVPWAIGRLPSDARADD